MELDEKSLDGTWTMNNKTGIEFFIITAIFIFIVLSTPSIILTFIGVKEPRHFLPRSKKWWRC